MESLRKSILDMQVIAVKGTHLLIQVFLYKKSAIKFILSKKLLIVFQLQNESLSLRLQEEIDNREEIEKK